MRRKILSLISVLLLGSLLLGLLPAASAWPVRTRSGYTPALAWAEELGLLGTVDFFPDQRLTRQDAALILWRYAEKPSQGAKGAEDLPKDAELSAACAWALGTGLIEPNEDGLFLPRQALTRAEAALLLWRYAGSPEAPAIGRFRDVQAADPCFAALAWAGQHSQLSGLTWTLFGPGAACTGGELVRMLFRLHPVMPRKEDEKSYLIVIDPGHQRQGDSRTEPNGPGSEEMKKRTSSGTYGSSSHLNEYELTLTVSLQLRDELERRGYRGALTRESHDVTLSNVERARFANELGADAVLRIHANGSTDTTAHGVETINMTENSPYNAELYPRSRALSEAVLDGLCASTGAARRYVWDTDTMTGINWSTVPVTIVEMGFMTNPEEDLRMADPVYQAKIVRGIADGVDQYFAQYGE